MFLDQQEKKKVESYKQLLSAVGSLSNLFSDSTTPYLNYRAAENIFCRVFDAENKSRGDVSVDAVKGQLGIGIKTFLFRSSQFEKVAEFNKLLNEYSGLDANEMIKKIAEARNERINTTSRLFDLNENIYHCIARKDSEFKIFETPMPLIDINEIKSIEDDGKTVFFTDGNNEYKFQRSKSTLFKKFHSTGKEVNFRVEILDDPYSKLLAGSLLGGFKDEDEKELESVILPLYSLRGGAHVPEKSGLNQWNAEGRTRSNNEVYIPIPIWIHRVFPEFFPPREQPFTLGLPDGNKISAKVCQQNGKALMSNPNSDLGEWLLRKVLDLKIGELVTYSKLLELGIDSVEVIKLGDGNFRIEFKETGTFEEFKDSLEVDTGTLD